MARLSDLCAPLEMAARLGRQVPPDPKSFRVDQCCKVSRFGGGTSHRHIGCAPQDWHGEKPWSLGAALLLQLERALEGLARRGLLLLLLLLCWLSFCRRLVFRRFGLFLVSRLLLLPFLCWRRLLLLLFLYRCSSFRWFSTILVVWILFRFLICVHNLNCDFFK